MKRVYQVKIGTDKETATHLLTVIRPNVIQACRAAIGVYRKDKARGAGLYGTARVLAVTEIAQLDA